MKKILLAAVAAVAIVGGAQARDQIRIVGSSTVYPFSSVVAENFGAKGNFKTPVVESTGTGGGAKLFCTGVGEATPDITNASRKMRTAEFDTCTRNGVKDIMEVMIGFDGIVLANAKAGPNFDVTRKQIYQAVAAQVPVAGKLTKNPYVNWSDIDKSLPKAKIQVMGPPPTSGTRDAFIELAVWEGARKFEMMDAMRGMDQKKFEQAAGKVREDGAWIDGGENDNIIVQTLVKSPTMMGVFGYSFLEENLDKIKGHKIDGVDPTFDNILTGDYPVSRSMYFYVKKQHIGVIPGVAEFTAEFVSTRAIGKTGYTIPKGLIPMPEAKRKQVEADVKAGKVMARP